MSADPTLIGPRIRFARQARRMTLEQVAAAAGVTQGFVSKVERDQVSPSVSSLLSLCTAVGIRVGDLFEAPRSSVVRAGEGSPINFGAVGTTEFLLTPTNQSHVQVIHSFIEPGGNGGAEQYSLECEVEFIYVVAGECEISLGDAVTTLGPGDSMTFNGREPHNWRNPSATVTTEVIWLIAPAT